MNRVVPKEKLLAEAEALLRKMLANGPVSLRFTLEAVNAGLEMPLAEAQYLEATLFGLICTTEDMKEGHAGLPREAAAASSRASEADGRRAGRAPDARGLRVALAALRLQRRGRGRPPGAARARRCSEMGAAAERHRRSSTCRAPSSCRWRRAAAARSGRFDAMVALGAVIRGETDHYEHIAREAAAGLAAVARETGVPVGFGVLTVARGGAGAWRARAAGPGQQGRGSGAGGGGHGPRAARGSRGDRGAGAAKRRSGTWVSGRKARECALQMLYQWDITREPMDRVAGLFWQVRTQHRRDAGHGGAAGARRAARAWTRSTRPITRACSRTGASTASPPWTATSCASPPTS